MISNKNWKAPKDYKVYCFNGVAKFVMICIGREKGGHPRFCFFDRNWEERKYSKAALNMTPIKIEKPDCIEKMFDIAENLAKPFPFVRVDFYISNNKIYFGELTFTPAGGLDVDYPEDVDRMLGDMIQLPKV